MPLYAMTDQELLKERNFYNRGYIQLLGATASSVTSGAIKKYAIGTIGFDANISAGLLGFALVLRDRRDYFDKLYRECIGKYRYDLEKGTFDKKWRQDFTLGFFAGSLGAMIVRVEFDNHPAVDASIGLGLTALGLGACVYEAHLELLEMQRLEKQRRTVVLHEGSL